MISFLVIKTQFEKLTIDDNIVIFYKKLSLQLTCFIVKVLTAHKMNATNKKIIK